MRHVVLAGLVLLLCGCGGRTDPFALVTESLDQDAGVTSPSSSGVNDTVDKATTFTVGITGLLSRIELMVHEVNAQTPLIIDVRETVAGVPLEDDNNVLASISVPTGTLPTTSGTFTSFDLEAFGIQVTAGQVLAICLRAPGSPAAPAYDWPTEADPYPGGNAFSRNPMAMVNTWSAGTHDAAFKTYVKHL